MLRRKHGRIEILDHQTLRWMVITAKQEFLLTAKQIRAIIHFTSKKFPFNEGWKPLENQNTHVG
uniref:Orf77 n=1 Tax=Brassica oleracea TaxID=3712 RepID=A0A3P6HAY9_BRAOL|nr:unnamed protein product [Brassica oleracea]